MARQLQRAGIETLALRDWLGGAHLHASDAQILDAAFVDQRVLVTYDSHTIPPLLRRWAQTGQHHAGVILIDQRTIRSNDVGGLVRALCALVAQDGGEEWLDRISHLKSA